MSLPKNAGVALVAVAVFLIVIGCLEHESINFVLTYGLVEFPTHGAPQGCTWVRKTYSKTGIHLYVWNCPTREGRLDYDSVYYENKAGKIIWEQPDQNRRETKFELFTKSAAARPFDVVKTEWYDKLTADQQKKCEIRSADHPNNSHGLEEPRFTPHKTRYEIVPKREVVDALVKKYDNPEESSDNRFICGNVVGAPIIGTYSPYFEFDDRSPDRYLMVHLFGQEGAVDVDINAITF